MLAIWHKNLLLKLKKYSKYWMILHLNRYLQTLQILYLREAHEFSLTFFIFSIFF